MGTAGMSHRVGSGCVCVYVCVCTLPVLLLSEDWDDRRLEHGDLHQSRALLGGLPVIVGHHQQLPRKHTLQLTFLRASQAADRATNAGKAKANAHIFAPLAVKEGTQAMLLAWELESRMSMPPSGLIIGSCFSFLFHLIGR